MRDFSKTIAAAALFALAVPAMADAQPKAAPAKPAAAVSGVNGDVRCLLTMVALGQNKERQQAAQLGVYYFAGRISARAPGLNLATLMRSEAGTLDGKALEAESRRCGPMITGSLQVVQAGLNSLRPAGPPPPAAPQAAPASPIPLPK